MTIVTVVLNAERYLEGAIKSVIAQSYPNIEYVIFDGGSRDGTLDIIRKYESHIDYWVSQPDNGISDAFNKGISLAQGDFIALLNADDWFSPDHIALAFAALSSSDASFTFGDLMFYDNQTRPLYRIKGDAEYASKIHKRCPDINHPTVLARRSLYDDIGGFDTTLRVAMDYDWLLRAHVRGHKGLYLPACVGHMRANGNSDNHYVGSYCDVRDITIKYGRNRAAAHAYCIWCLVKTWTRYRMESVLPSAVPAAIRRTIHPGLQNAGGSR